MHNFKELKVWQQGIDLVVETYRRTKIFPDSEKFALTNQIRRASVSIPSNIAEGCGRSSNKAFRNFLDISLGSCFELETQLIISERLEFLDKDSFENLNEQVTSIEKMIFKLHKSLDT